MDIQKILADNIYKYRKDAGLSQEHLAERCGLHRTYIGGIEQCRTNVGIKNVQRIAEALGVSARQLFDDRDEADCATTKKISWQEAQELVEHAILDTNSDPSAKFNKNKSCLDASLESGNDNQTAHKQTCEQGHANPHLNTDPNTRYAFCVISQDKVDIEDLDVIDPNIAMQILSNLLYNHCKKEDLSYQFHRIQYELLDYIKEHAKSNV